jgi:hypothetical protein
MEDILYLLQKTLDKKVINRNIQNFDQSRYNLFALSIITMINIVSPGDTLTEDNVILHFTENYILISCKSDVSMQTSGLVIYIQIRDNIIIGSEVSILV